MEVEPRTFISIAPEITLASVAVIVMLGGACVRSKSGWVVAAAIGFVAAGILLFRQIGPPFAFTLGEPSGNLVFDQLSGAMRWASLVFGFLFVLMFARRAGQDGGGELLGMLLLLVVGLMLVASTADMLGIFVAIELVSIPTYVLLYLGRSGRRSAEATAKYFFLSILASGFFLMGLVLLYGLTGTIQLAEVGAAMERLGAEQALVRPALLAMILLVASLGFKLAAVPFHFYAPDVYLATSNVNAGLLAVAPKVAGMIAMARLTTVIVPVFPEFGWQVVMILSILSMTIGNVGALLQRNVRRMLAYSSIAHAGYMLIGVAVGLYQRDVTLAYGGFAATFLYLLVYGFASIGTFAALDEVDETDHSTGAIASLSGLARRRPWMAGVIAICLFSLAGLPPLAGFWGKLTLFGSALTVYRTGEGSSLFLMLAVVGVVNAAIAAAYYLRIIGKMYFDDTPTVSDEQIGLGSVAAVACAVLVVSCGLFPGPLVNQYRGLDNVRIIRESLSQSQPLSASDTPQLVSHGSPRIP